MELVDAHVHTFPLMGGLGAELGRRLASVLDAAGVLVSIREQAEPPQPEQAPGPGFAYPVEALLGNLDAAGVGPAVLLQGPVYGDQNPYVAQVARRYPQRLAAVAYLDPWAPGAPAQFAELVADPLWRGVKLEMSETSGLLALHPGARLDEPGLRWLWEGLARQGLVLTLDLGPIGSASYQTEAVRGLAERWPELKLVVCHLAQPGPQMETDSDRRGRWEAQLSLGCLPHVWFDTAALAFHVAAEGFPFPSAGRYLARACELIGPEKLLWGSDLPMMLQIATYDQLVELAHGHTAFLSAEDQTAVLGGNARRVYWGAVANAADGRGGA